MSRFLERLGGERLYCDGATGSFLQTRGLKGGELAERWNLTRPDDVIALARAYFEAGSDIVNTNTFGANRLHYPDPEELDAIVKAGVEHVRTGMKLAGRDDGFVALDIGPTGRLIHPLGDLGFEEAVELFAQVVRAGAQAGADLVMIETMGDTREVKAAVLAAKENCELPVCVTTAYQKNAHLLTGADVDSTAVLLESLGVDAMGMNCGIDPKQMLPIARRLSEIASVPVICNPNAGPPRQEDGRPVYDLSPDEFAQAMVEIASCGIQVLGGCCGTTPDYIRRVIRETRQIPVMPPKPESGDRISSATKVVDITSEDLQIGGRLHPSEGEEYRKALREGDLDYLVDLGFEQEEEGAQILLLNVGVEGVDEAALMEEAVVELQSALSLPLLLESSDPKVLERGLRQYNGRAAVWYGKENQEAILPVIEKYGAAVLNPQDRS